MSGALRLQVVHETAYRYGTRVELARHLAHLSPLTTMWQRVETTTLTIDPEPAHRATSDDVFGNLQTFFALHTPHDRLRVRASSRVQLTSRDENSDAAQSPPWSAVSESLHYSAGVPFCAAAEFVFASPFVPIHDELGAYAAVSFPPGRPLAEGALDLMHRIHDEFEYRSGSTEVSTPVREAFRRRQGVCQDFAHVMIGCMRALGLAARYVSGYLLTSPPDGQPALVGTDASHAWVSIWCPESGWIDLDPTNDALVDTSHVTLAIGRDYGDVMPLRGVIQGGGEHTLAVAVQVQHLA